MTLKEALTKYDCDTVQSGVNIMRRCMNEGASFEDARAAANAFMALRFKQRSAIEQTARVLCGMPAHESDAIH
jgi:hypothetical protein